MGRDQIIACVTGASGMVGARIVQRLVLEGYRVRALSRRYYVNDPGVDFFCGGLEDEGIIKSFLQGAHLLFHCAAELNDRAKMWKVNVMGTERLLNLAAASGIQYLCYLSSAGVIGKTKLLWVDESSACHPENDYERSKWAAEQIVAQGISGCRVAILRPTNVVDIHKPGAIGMPMRRGWSDRLKVFLKGGECAHIVHADDVAQAALYLNSCPIYAPECFFVSCDHERFNTFGGLWSLYNVIQRGRPIESIAPMIHLPIIIPHILRRISRGAGNYGNVRYSSEKLLSMGFRFSFGVEGSVRLIAETKRPMDT